MLDKYFPCPHCEGKGYVLHLPWGSSPHAYVCYTCEGEGEVHMKVLKDRIWFVPASRPVVTEDAK